MTIRIESPDSLLSDTVLTSCMRHLNYYIRKRVQTEVKDNITFLNHQLVSVSDPLIKEKILSLLASEVEKEMLVSQDVYKLIDSKYVYWQYKEKMLYPILFGIIAFIISTLFVVIKHALFSGQLTENDRTIMSLISESLNFLPKKKSRIKGL